VTWWTPNGQLNQGIDPEIVTSPVRYGNNAIKIRAQQNWNGISDYTRTELIGKRNDSRIHNTFFYPGKEYWIGFSIYLPNDWQTDYKSEEVLFQLHGNGNEDSPSLALLVDGAEWYWSIRWQDEFEAPEDPKDRIDLGRRTYEKGQWVDYVIHAKFSYSDDGYGFMEIWKDGTSLFTHNGPNCYNDGSKIRGPQTGVYKWDWSNGADYEVSERIMYLDEYKVGGSGASYEDVAPRGQVPLQANFEFSKNGCDSKIMFTDVSQGNPTSWEWDFGDGNSSLIQNPSHTYATAGDYTVVFKATNDNESNSFSKQISVTDGPTKPVVENAERCDEGTLTLVATADQTIKWYDTKTGGTLLVTESSFTTPLLTETTTYYVENSYEGNVNGAKNNKGTGEYYKWEDADASWGLKFDAKADIIIKSVKIYNGESDNGSYAGERTFTVVDASGTEIGAATVNVVSGEQKITLNIEVPAGTNYRLLSDRHIGLWKDTDGVTYPYEIGSNVSITGGVRYDGIPSSDYFFFYDWEVQIGDGSSCTSERVPVTATILNGSEVVADYNYQVNNNTVTFTNKSTGAESYYWDFGNEQFSEEVNPVVIYEDGYYTATLTVFNGECEDTVSYSFRVGPEPVYNSLSDYDFIEDGYGYLTSPSTPSQGTQTPYVPNLSDLSTLDIIYVSPNGAGSGASESDPTTLYSVFSGTIENKVVIALEGTYIFNTTIKINNVNNVYLIAKNKGKAIFELNDDSIFEFPNSNAEIHNFSIIGFKSTGNGNRNDNYFIFGPGNGLHYNAYNIYLSDMEWSDYSCVVYSGLHSHDWTIDKSQFYNSTYEYIWYMMGWHHTLMNTVMYNNSYLSVVIRGSYPPNEEYIYNGSNTLIADRTEHFLADDDWTHLIINNTFGSCHNFIENHENDIHMGLWYDIPSDEAGKTEDCYFPPKNIIIANNAFIDSGKLNKEAILFAASRGVNDPVKSNVASVNGIIIKNNYTDKSKLIHPFGTTDMSSVDLTSNVLNFTNFGFDDENRDYTITSSSELINMGATGIYFPNVDNTGNYRSDAPDVGAYEYHSTLGTEIPDLAKFSIYPNPSNGIVHIKLEDFVNDIKISIINMFGQTVRTFNIKNSDFIEFDLSELTTGMYFIKSQLL